MPNTATIYLPLNTFVSVACFTNAAFLQQVTITPETGNAWVLTGSGENNSPMPNGSFSLTTPSHSQSNQGYRMVVSVQAQQQNQQWAPSQVSQGGCLVMYYSLAMVISEDYVDQDWNDAVVQFSWWIPPSARSQERAAQIEAAHSADREASRR